jgi:MFS family permease
MKQRSTQSKEVLDPALLASEAYKEVLQQRHSFRFIGYLCFGAALLVIAAFVMVAVRLKTVWLGWNWIIFLALLVCEVPAALYSGYLPITAQEVARKRQQNRSRTFKQAQGRKPYGYIFLFIIFPSLLWLFTISYFVGIGLFLAFPAPYSIAPFWRIGGLALIVLLSLIFTYLLAKITYRSLKHVKYVSREKWQELRTQLVCNEFEQ